MQSRRKLPRVASTVKTMRRLLVAGCHCVFTRDLFVMSVLLFRLVFTLGRFLRGGRHFHEDQRQQGENQGLHHSHKKLKRDEYHVAYSGQQESENRQHRAACKEIAEKTESE